MDIELDRIVDTERYPIHPLSSQAAEELVENCRESMRADGLCLLPSFVRREALAVMRDEAQTAASRAFFCHNTHNAYLRDDDPLSLGRATVHRPYCSLPATSSIRAPPRALGTE